MALDQLTKQELDLTEDTPSVIDNVPSLRVIQGGLADSPDARLEQKEIKRFHLNGADQLGGLTVLRGEVDGKPMAIVIPTHSLPPEEGRPDTAFEKIRTGTFGKVAAALALVGASVAVLAGCAPDNKPKIGSSHAALSADDLNNLDEDGNPAAWTEFGDANNGFEISDIDGTTVIIFGRGGDLFSVNCDELESCLAAGEPVAIEGLPAGTYAKGAIYQTPEGIYKLMYQIGTLIRQRDVGYDVASGTFTITGSSETFSPGMSGGMSYMKIGGVPHVLWGTGISDGINLRNLYTGDDTLLDLDGGPMAICGEPHQDDGGVAIGSFLFDPDGPGGTPTYCRLHSAPTLNELAEVLESDFIDSQNIAGVDLTNPRSYGNILIYVREDADGTRIYYAIAPIVPPADGGGDADGGTDADSGPGAVDDGGDSPDTGIDADAGPGGGPEAGTGDGDAGPGDGDAGEGEDEDAGPDPDGPTTPREDGGNREDGGKPKPDASPDTPQGNPDECILDPGTVRITEGSCLFDQCEDQFAQVSGQCTFEVNLGGENPVIIEIDGTYSMDLLERLGGLLRGSYRVVDDGNAMGTVYGDFGTGVSGTTYGGEEYAAENRYRVFCEEGLIVITFRGQEIARLSGGQELTFDTRTGEAITEDPNPPGCSCSTPGSEPSSTQQSLVLGSLLLGLAALFRRSRRKGKIA